jgi:hypothetical protein
MLMVQQAVLPINSIPFDRNNDCLSYEMLLSIPTASGEASGQVA